ncbi:unnamed protein product [Brassica napus]|uniref:(rape) hypothetical protein n=1 Tax=Brassica napus TaxID=3708 RepID=A0A817A8H5_BRANA|nr:unnamed protein product [Brassica napus]
MIREFAKNRVRVPSFLKSAKLNFTELEINSSSLPINLHVLSIASSSAILRVPKMCSTSFSISVTGAFSRYFHTTDVHRQRCHYLCDRKKMEKSSWSLTKRDPTGVSTPSFFLCRRR